MSRILLFLIVTLFISLKGFSGPGDWTQYLSMNKTFKVIEGDGKIFFASEGGIFYFNLNDNSIETLTKIDGLTESEIKTIGYNSSTSTLIIAYTNSSIDLVNERGTIFPITDIKRKNIQGDNSIHNMYQFNDKCYLSCGFGIVVLDLAKEEIKDTYIIGANGGYLAINDVAILDNEIYAATTDGLKFANLDANLLDYSNWSKISPIDELPDTEYLYVETSDNDIYCVSRYEDKTYGNAVYKRNESNEWKRYSIGISSIYEFEINGNEVIIPTNDNTSILNLTSNEVQKITQYDFLEASDLRAARSTIKDSDGNIWIADYENGAVLVQGDTETLILPEGPIDNSIFSLTFTNNKLWIAKGGFQDTRSGTFNQVLVQSFDGVNWDDFSKKNFPDWTDRRDAALITGIPNSENHVLISVWGSGIFELKNGEIINHFNESNSTLESIIPGQKYIRVEGMTYDNEGNLWVTNGQVEKNLHCYKNDGTWQSYFLPEVANGYTVGKVIYTQYNDLWMIIPRGKTNGLYVMSSDGTQKKSLNVASYFTNGDDIVITPMNDVYDIVEDQDGEIWVATTQGITTYSSPYNVFDSNPYYAYQPGLDLNDGIYHPLLATETVTCLAVDGGNRKFCGTMNSGLYLISENGETEIAHYTTSNSPLTSNTITSLAYDGDSGTLYVGCQGGLVSLKTDAKSGEATYDQIYAFPNPVREDYDGDIYISGLLNETTVKITTVSGRLVYQTNSIGGQAVWPGTDLDGNRVHTGVYLVFCSANDGEDAAVTKILFIR